MEKIPLKEKLKFIREIEERIRGKPTQLRVGIGSAFYIGYLHRILECSDGVITCGVGTQEEETHKEIIPFEEFAAYFNFNGREE